MTLIRLINLLRTLAVSGGYPAVFVLGGKEYTAGKVVNTHTIVDEEGDGIEIKTQIFLQPISGGD